MNIENQRFEAWRKEQIASLIRMGYPDAAKAFNDLGSVQWAGWQAGWQASRAAVEIDLPAIDDPDCGQRVSFHLGAYKGQCRQAIEAAGIKVK